MRPFRSILAAGCATLVAALTLAGAGDAEARRRQRDEPADFDFYLMVFSIAPSFCRLVGEARGKRQCDEPSDADYRATPLTVHGLWPNRKNRSVNQQPAFCSNEALALSPELRRKLRVYMPGMADGLQEHEWRRHGVCSGLTPEEYFGKIVGLAEKANATIGAVLREKGLFGREVPVRTLLQGVAEKSRALADAIVVDCKFPRRGGPAGPDGRSRAYVAEIRVLISKDIGRDPDGDGWPGPFVPLAEVGYGANSGCPGGAGFIPGGFGS
jgi:ribonuclease T2